MSSVLQGYAGPLDYAAVNFPTVRHTQMLGLKRAQTGFTKHQVYLGYSYFDCRNASSS